MGYRIGISSKLEELSRTPTAPGSGPRHLVQHPTMPFVYVVSELANLVTTYRLESSGKLTHVMNITTLPDGESEKGYGSKAAELVISADGTTLYASNRAFLPG